MKFRIELANPGQDVSCIIQTRVLFMWFTWYRHDTNVEHHVEYVPEVFEDFHDAWEFAQAHWPDATYWPKKSLR